jgi:membrane associated rhomboid family serine protease
MSLHVLTIIRIIFILWNIEIKFYNWWWRLVSNQWLHLDVDLP